MLLFGKNKEDFYKKIESVLQEINVQKEENKKLNVRMDAIEKQLIEFQSVLTEQLERVAAQIVGNMQTHNCEVQTKIAEMQEQASCSTTDILKRLEDFQNAYNMQTEKILDKQNIEKQRINTQIEALGEMQNEVFKKTTCQLEQSKAQVISTVCEQGDAAQKKSEEMHTETKEMVSDCFEKIGTLQKELNVQKERMLEVHNAGNQKLNVQLERMERKWAGDQEKQAARLEQKEIQLNKLSRQNETILREIESDMRLVLLNLIMDELP